MGEETFVWQNATTASKNTLASIFGIYVIIVI
jgi:hypothetical protein